jgi:hypothetical protein
MMRVRRKWKLDVDSVAKPESFVKWDKVVFSSLPAELPFFPLSDICCVIAGL